MNTCAQERWTKKKKRNERRREQRKVVEEEQIDETHKTEIGKWRKWKEQKEPFKHS